MMKTKNWNAKIIDIVTAFLGGDLDQETFMKVPEGYYEDSSQEEILKLHKPIYGLV